MNPLRHVGEEWTPWLIGVLLLALLVLGVAWWGRRRERRGDWGPGLVGAPPASGYAPADLRAGDGAAGAQPGDPRDAWLLGLAAPFVEQAGLLHERWSLVPAGCDDRWKRRLVAVANAWGAARSRDWRVRIAETEQRLRALSEAPDPDRSVDLRPWLTAQLAMQLRLGVAARHIAAPRARRRLAEAAAALRRDDTGLRAYRDWLGYGDAIAVAAERLRPDGAMDLRADLRTLYAPDGPWQAVEWPSAG